MNRPAIIGILNVTPDSFSGDGRFAQQAVEHAQAQLRDGADILDIGAESTRPGANVIGADEEWARLEPVLMGIIEHSWRTELRLSIDTRHAQTAERALALGVEIINDVSGFADPDMLSVLEEHDCDIIVMHALSVPVDPQKTLPPDCDVVAEILRWKTAITSKAVARNIAPERLIYDPGIGFGKTAVQSRALIDAAAQLKASGGRWLIGHSRKSFLGLPKDASNAVRDAATREISLQLAKAGIDYVRVHDVAGHSRLFA